MIITIKPFSVALWGPLAIHGYGIAVFLGVFLAYYALTHDTICKTLIDKDLLDKLVSQSIIVGFLGGRLLHIISERHTFSLSTACAPWIGGFSILGTVISIAFYIIYSTRKYKIALMPLIERIALYAPLAHALGRLGCWWAGCCFGVITSASALVSCSYTGNTAGAPCDSLLMPIQLYSAVWYIALFIVLKVLTTRIRTSSQMILGTYLLGVSGERLVLDFWRGDRIMTFSSMLSVHQWIALMLCFLGVCVLLADKNLCKSYSIK